MALCLELNDRRDDEQVVDHPLKILSTCPRHLSALDRCFARDRPRGLPAFLLREHGRALLACHHAPESSLSFTWAPLFAAVSGPLPQVLLSQPPPPEGRGAPLVFLLYHLQWGGRDPGFFFPCASLPPLALFLYEGFIIRRVCANIEVFCICVDVIGSDRWRAHTSWVQPKKAQAL